MPPKHFNFLDRPVLIASTLLRTTVNIATRWARGSVFTLGVLILGLTVMVQNFALLREVRQSRLRHASTYLKQGGLLSEIAGASLSGEFRRIRFPLNSNKAMVIVTIATDCLACRTHHQRFHELAEVVRKERGWMVLWVSRSASPATLRYCRELDIPLAEVITDVTHRSYRDLGLEVVPQVTVVDNNGKILRVWEGAQPWTTGQILATRDVEP